MTQQDYIDEIDEMIADLPEPMGREAAFAIYGYATALANMGEIEQADYERIWGRLPITGEDVADEGVNI